MNKPTIGKRITSIKTRIKTSPSLITYTLNAPVKE